MSTFVNLSVGSALLLLLGACSDDKAMVTCYDASVKKNPISCLRLQIVPEDQKMRAVLLRLYPFTEGCRQRLSVSYKSGIVCNSAYNAPQKALSNFPNSYLNMEIRKGFTLQYSYYIDLDHKPTAYDLKRGFSRLSKELNIVAVSQ